MILDQRREKDTKIEDEKEMKNKPKKKKALEKNGYCCICLFTNRTSQDPPPSYVLSFINKP